LSTLEWRAATPVLQAIFAAYEEAGAPENGVETEKVLRALDDAESARAVVRELARSDYLETLIDVDGSDVPVTVRPTPRTLQLLAGWPSGSAEAALDELVAALDEAIGSAPTDEERSKLSRVRDGLLGAARDVALAYFEKKIGA
jgi:hypothetical protein